MRNDYDDYDDDGGIAKKKIDKNADVRKAGVRIKDSCKKQECYDYV